MLSIVGARNKELVILEREMRAVSDSLMITTDDGSYADKGFVTDKLRQLIENGTRIDLVIAVGPIVMMRAVAELTRKENIHTVVSLNPIMIDGTGMCGGCRVMIDGKSEFACVDGPEFDAHKVDFAVLVQRNGMYRDAEQRSLAEFESAKAREPEAACARRLRRARRSTMTTTAKKSQNPLSPKERMKVPRQLMPEQPADERAHTFTEVNLGYSAELAQQEALRCLECAKPTCTDNCPVGVKVKEFVEKIVIGDFLGAAATIRQDNVLPAVTGRVCPQEDQCEGKCLLSKKVKPLGIGYLERFVADYEQRLGTHVVPQAPPTGKKVAVVGSGPSGLTVAGDLIQKGHAVRVFEALHEVGGVLVYGIPEFRLPKQIVREQIAYMKEMGVEFETDVVIGRTVTVDELLEEEGYDAVYIGTGAGLPQFMNIPGEHLNGVYAANEFLTRINLMKAYKFPTYDEPMLDLHGKDVAVIGGGNTALDAIRSALRLGARKAYVIYRRSEAEMPARAEEAHHARQEGIDFQMLTAPVEFVSDGKGWLTAARCVRMELGEPDASGRRRPVPKKDRNSICPCPSPSSRLERAPTRSCRARRQGWEQTSAATFRPAKKRNARRERAYLREATS